jgi:23S rRNA pseudouridine2605 synthase
MRINRFIATATGLSRRAADAAIEQGQVNVNDKPAGIGQDVSSDDVVTFNGRTLHASEDMQFQTILLYKPVGYVCSRNGQGSRTIYDLLPKKLHQLKPIGRLDKDSSGLLLLTNDGALAHQLTHPSFQKTKTYEVQLDKPLMPLHRQMISDHGVQLDDGPSKLQLERLTDGIDTNWQITMHEGRNRQIRRTFAALGYTVVKLRRTSFGSYTLLDLKPGAYTPVY